MRKIWFIFPCVRFGSTAIVRKSHLQPSRIEYLELFAPQKIQVIRYFGRHSRRMKNLKCITIQNHRHLNFSVFFPKIHSDQIIYSNLRILRLQSVRFSKPRRLFFPKLEEVLLFRCQNVHLIPLDGKSHPRIKNINVNLNDYKVVKDLYLRSPNLESFKSQGELNLINTDWFLNRSEKTGNPLKKLERIGLVMDYEHTWPQRKMDEWRDIALQIKKFEMSFTLFTETSSMKGLLDTDYPLLKSLLLISDYNNFCRMYETPKGGNWSFSEKLEILKITLTNHRGLEIDEEMGVNDIFKMNQFPSLKELSLFSCDFGGELLGSKWKPLPKIRNLEVCSILIGDNLFQDPNFPILEFLSLENPSVIDGICTIRGSRWHPNNFKNLITLSLVNLQLMTDKIFQHVEFPKLTQIKLQKTPKIIGRRWLKMKSLNIVKLTSNAQFLQTTVEELENDGVIVHVGRTEN